MLGLAAALGGGLLIGLERERRKGRGAHRGAAGIRSFALASLGGGVAMALAMPALVFAGALLVAALAALAYRASLAPRAAGAPPVDPGLTSELALFVTYLVGVLCVHSPALGAGAAAAVALLLALRERLHALATEVLSEAEVHDALLLAALVLVLLPLASPAPAGWLGGVAPRTLLLTALLILVVQAAGHVALRLFGARAGLLLAGLLGGFVSSTATIASMAAQARSRPALFRPCLAGGLASTAATWLQVGVLVAALAPGVLPRLLPMVLAGAAAALLVAGGVACGSGLAQAAAGSGAAPAGRADAHSDAHSDARAGSDGPLRIRPALLIAALLAGVAAGVDWAQAQFGPGAVLAATALAAVADAHAPVAALAGLHGHGRLPADTLLHACWVAIGINSVTRSVTAVAAGGWRFGGATAAGLVAGALAAGAAHLMVGA